jgi:adenylosuccinate synthase
MGQEISWNEVARRSGLKLSDLKAAEVTSTTKRKRRVAEFNWELLRSSAALNCPTDLALTFADYLSAKNKDARRFEQLQEETIRFVEEVERVAMAPASLIATRFHDRSIIDRRAWGGS